MEHVQVFSSLALAISIGYFFLKMYLLSHDVQQKYPLTTFPNITVLVPFRDEEKSISACCESLMKLDYPIENLEILLLNDDSQDNSVQIATEKIKSKRHIKIIDVQGEKAGLKAKMNVLAEGLKIAKGEFIFVTDADCTVSPGWIKNTLEFFNDKIALISGFTVLNDKQRSLFKILQKVDWIFLQSLAYTASNAKKPFTVIGNNLAFKKEVYDQIGGFEKIGFSITEDHALMKAIIERSEYEVAYIQDKEAIVESLPAGNFKYFVKQRLRWLKGGLTGSAFAYFLIGTIFISHLVVIFLLTSGLWNPLTSIAIGLIVGIDYFFLKSSLKALNLISLKKYFLLYEIFYFLYPIVLFILLPFTRTISWKGRKYIKKGA